MRRLSPYWILLIWLVWLIWPAPLAVCARTASTEADIESTCSSTAVNYITQTLPQQCLRADWTRSVEDTATDDRRHSTGSERADAIIPTQAEEPVPAASSISTDGHVQDSLGPSPVSSAVPSAVSSAVSAPVSTGTTTSGTGSQSSESPAASGVQDESKEEESDPLSEHGHFLSFEEWKAQMLEKAGQSPDNVSGTTVGKGQGRNGRRQVGIEDALDALGDDGEIELDFSGFVNSESVPDSRRELSVDTEKTPKPSESGVDKAKGSRRSKEAGTTSKERFNYASFDCAATILKTNTGSKGATWILSENKDSYLLNKCSEKEKYFIVELCSDIWIDTVVLGNFEFFSSTFRHFRVSISDQYPVKGDKWKEIGTFEASNTRGAQAFLVEDGVAWARYFKIEFLTHYGKEYYCPVSLLRVHGKTMMDDFRNDMKAHEQEDNDDEEEASAEDEPSENASIEPVSKTVRSSGMGDTDVSPKASTPTPEPSAENNMGSDEAAPTCQISPGSEIHGVSSPLLGSHVNHQTDLTCNLKDESLFSYSMSTTNVADSTSSSVVDSSDVITSASQAHGEQINGRHSTSTTSAQSTSHTHVNTDSKRLTTSEISSTNTSSSSDSSPTESTSAATIATESGSTVSGSSSVEKKKTSVSQVVASTSPMPSADSEVNKESPSLTKDANSTTQNGTGHKPKSPKTVLTVKGTPAVPTTQDSFFRAIHKRLQLLESNSTLSLQYIEEQSRILRDAFGKAERRQLLRTSNFLETLNSTVLGELRVVRTQYDQIWQSTVLELASQREQSRKEVRALGERLSLLADELVWQKRVVYLQFILIVLCLGLVIFSKNGIAGASGAAPLELSLLQSIQHLRRHGVGSGRTGVSFTKGYSSSPESPPATPSRQNNLKGFLRRQSGHGRYLSDGVTSGEEMGIGTEVTTSPEQKQGMRTHSKLSDGDFVHPHHSSLGDLTVPTEHSSSNLTQEEFLSPPATLGNDVNVQPSIIVRNGDFPDQFDDSAAASGDDSLLKADLMPLKRAASSPALGQQAEESEKSTGYRTTSDDGDTLLTA